MKNTAPDRLEHLLDQDLVTGIDFIHVHPDQVNLDVYFLRSPTTLQDPLVGSLGLDKIHIYSPEAGVEYPSIAIQNIIWEVKEGKSVLHVITKKPGDFLWYHFFIDDPRIDPYYNDLPFYFKAVCENNLDCKASSHECPEEEVVDFPVNYLARDFWSYRQALLDFAAQRYPNWKEQLEADAGMMLLEAMSALGDEMAYYQDRIAREAYLETASQRRSLRKHARLIDYTVHDGLGATAWLDIRVKTGMNGVIPAGTDVWAIRDNGVPIHFEIGTGLRDIIQSDGSLKTYQVDASRNSFFAHLWDEDDTCLPVGATDLYIREDHLGNLLPFDDLPPDKAPGKWMLLRSFTEAPVRERTHLVRLISVKKMEDPVFQQVITHLTWEKEQATPFEMDLRSLTVHANIVPVTNGQTFASYFVIGADPENLEELPASRQQMLQRAVEREGPNGSIAYLFSLPGSEDRPLIFLGLDPRNARPELRLVEVEFDTATQNWVEKPEKWSWRRSLLGRFSSQSQDQDYYLEDGSWKPVVTYQRPGSAIKHLDYASNAGMSLRFGDGEFGMVPAEKTIFRLEYRLGNGRQANVPAGAIQYIDPAPYDFIQSLSNPMPASGGLEPESANEIRQLAPEAFREETYRAVRPEDYAEAAERLGWVQRAGAAFRWTGSWLSTFVTADPRGAVLISEPQGRELKRQMERFRQAGREAHTLAPCYADLDLEISVCASPETFPGQLKESLTEKLLGKKGVRSQAGYFSPDYFTFGTPLERSTLEAAIQEVKGVRAVEEIQIARRGWFEKRPFTKLYYDPGKDTIIRVENDPLHPERGTLTIKVNGGA